MIGRDTATCTSSITTGSTTGSISSLNFTEWVDTIASKVNTSVTQSLPNFNEWANGVAHNTFQLIQNYILTSLNLMSRYYKLQEIRHKSL